MVSEKKIITSLSEKDGEFASSFANHTPINIRNLSGVEKSANAWSPPYLLVAAAESCFFLTMFSVAEKMRVKIKSYSSTAEGSLSSPDGKHYDISEITIKPKIELENEADQTKIFKLAQMTEEYCLVERSLKTKVKIELPVE